MRGSRGLRATALAGLGVCALGGAVVATASGQDEAASARTSAATATPIKHVVVIYQENVSFDHYFGTYPRGAKTPGLPVLPPLGKHRVNGLANTPGLGGNGNLLTNNPNLDAAGHQVNPRWLDPSKINDVLTCSQDHEYPDEQKAFDGGKMDRFVTSVGTAGGTSATGQPCQADDTMNYYDGETVTGLWTTRARSR
jgi:phospholipase C